LKTRQYIQIYKPDVNDFTTTGDDYVPVPFKIDGSEKTHDYWDTWHLTGARVLLFSATTNDLKVKIVGSLDGITFPQSVEAEFTVPTSAVVEKRMTTYWPYLQVQVKPAATGQNGTLKVQAIGTTLPSMADLSVTALLDKTGLATENTLSTIDGKLAKGDQNKASSLSVTPATDITDGRYIGDIKFGEELPAGTQLIGKIGIDQTTPGITNLVNVNGGASQTTDIKVTLDSESVAVTGPLTNAELTAQALATEATLGTMKADIALMKTDLAAIRAILES